MNNAILNKILCRFGDVQTALEQAGVEATDEKVFRYMEMEQRERLIKALAYYSRAGVGL